MFPYLQRPSYCKTRVSNLLNVKFLYQPFSEIDFAINVVHEKKTLFEMQYLQNYLNMKKAFQDCFRPFLIPTLNIIINQDEKQIKIPFPIACINWPRGCNYKTPRGVPTEEQVLQVLELHKRVCNKRAIDNLPSKASDSKSHGFLKPSPRKNGLSGFSAISFIVAIALKVSYPSE